MKLIIAKMIWTFDLELGDRNKADWTDQKIWLTYEKEPLWVNVKVKVGMKNQEPGWGGNGEVIEWGGEFELFEIRDLVRVFIYILYLCKLVEIFFWCMYERMKGGKWKMEDGRWRMKHGVWNVKSSLWNPQCEILSVKSPLWNPQAEILRVSYAVLNTKKKKKINENTINQSPYPQKKKSLQIFILSSFTKKSWLIYTFPSIPFHSNLSQSPPDSPLKIRIRIRLNTIYPLSFNLVVKSNQPPK